MRRMCWVFLSVFALVPVISRAENCAWLNAATAGGLLGGEVTSKVIHTSEDDATCEFVLNRATSVSVLQIEVHTMTAHEKDFPRFLVLCGANATHLRAVGNEAVECAQSNEPERITELIVSRVRERAFIVKWTRPRPNADVSAPAPDDIRERIRNVAEQVAGSLF